MITIDVDIDFGYMPVGIFRSDGVCSAQEFSEDLLVPALKTGDVVTVVFDGFVVTPSAAWLRAVFEGLVTVHGFCKEDLLKTLYVTSTFKSIASLSYAYMELAGVDMGDMYTGQYLMANKISLDNWHDRKPVDEEYSKTSFIQRLRIRVRNYLRRMYIC